MQKRVIFAATAAKNGAFATSVFLKDTQILDQTD